MGIQDPPLRSAMNETPTPYDIISLLPEIHRVQLDLLREFDRVTEELGLRYFAMHGTLLGAVRHGGFIPWDDDVDLAMPREDFDRLPREYRVKRPYWLQTEEREPRCFFGGYARFRNGDTTALDPDLKGIFCNQGIWIDIFPLDAVPSDEKLRSRQARKIRFFQNLMYAKVYPDRNMLRDVPMKKISRYFRLAGRIPRRILRKEFYRALTSCRESEKTSILACYYGNAENTSLWDTSLFEEVKRIPFEGDFRIPVPGGYDEILRKRYGEGCMQAPSSVRPKHTNIYFDPANSCWDYLKGNIQQP